MARKVPAKKIAYGSRDKKLKCDVCGGMYAERYLGTHKRRAHDVYGGLTGRQRKNGVKGAKRAKKVNRSNNGLFTSTGLDLILQHMFPNGIPNDSIPEVVKWMESTVELTKGAK